MRVGDFLRLGWLTLDVSPNNFARRSFLKVAVRSLGAIEMSCQPPKSPNVILILCDDLGFGDLHSYGSSIATPNIDGMATGAACASGSSTRLVMCAPHREQR